MKILAIGNSFSQDATKYLQNIAASANEPLFVRNLYIGGCSLEMHTTNIKNNAYAYDYEIDAESTEKISIVEALEREEWDHVTVQQVSGRAGKAETYEPYLSFIIKTIKDHCPNAEIAFHQTWAYEIGSSHPNFAAYNRSQMEMYGSIVSATTEKAAIAHGLKIIPTGDLIQQLRNVVPFDYKNGGISLCRDGFHLSLSYGRFAAAVCWFKFFTGKSAKDITFIPEGANERYIEIIKELADKMM